MALIEREAAIALIEQKQKELCPVGRFSRNAVYGTDRDRFDAWDEIIDQIDALPAIDAAPVVHGEWKYYHKKNKAVCTNCSFERDLDTNLGKAVSCPNCGTLMDGGDGHEAD